MGNRGTTPSWDDEQIAKYGVVAHLSFETRLRRARYTAEREELVAKHIDIVISLLPSPSEETISRVRVAIPEVVYVLPMLDIAIPDWKRSIASDVHSDWQRRTNQSDATNFYALSEEDQQPFIQIVEVVVTAIEKGGQNPNAAAK